ncbi:uncharacterized protein [Musca autumnalis]|uniref:uncharacterized protein n=1 Tax=Musca autumnalis TaxID=221902 RepID=UPI003CEB2D18
MPATKAIKCRVCCQSLTKSQSRVSCKACNVWFHASCANIDEKNLSVLRTVKEFAYICASCLPNLNSNNNNNDNNRADNNDVIGKINSLTTKLDSFMLNYQAEQNRLTTVLNDIKQEVSSFVAEMRADIGRCNDNVRRVEASTSAKFVALEKEDNIMHKRINRSDILIGGLPEGIDDLEAPVIALGTFYNIPVTSMDINHVCYINRKKQILVKFNKVSKRDLLMKEYFKTRNLKVSDLLGTQGVGLTSRVYLNDHFSPAAARLNFVCKKLQRLKMVSKFKILNSDILKAWLRFPDGREDTYSASQCDALLHDVEGGDV